MKYKIIMASDLGNCWSPHRFCGGGRCPKVMNCQHKEKKTCKAVETEISYLNEQANKVIKSLKQKIKTTLQNTNDKKASLNTK